MTPTEPTLTPEWLKEVRGNCERAIMERNAWENSAARAYRDVDFYRGIVIQIGELFGVEAKTSDDGSIQEDVLALKVPELVNALRAERDALKAKADALAGAADEFGRARRMLDSLPPSHAVRDGTPLVECLPGIWPTMKNLRQLESALAAYRDGEK